MPTDRGLLDRLAIRELIDNWATFRDVGRWDDFRALWHPDGVMMAIAPMLRALMLLTPSVRTNPMTFVANLAGHESPSNSAQTTGIENAHPPKKIPSPPESRIPIDRMP